MVTDLGIRPSRVNLDDELSKEIDFILRNHREIDDADELLPYRSGSAPPTVEGSCAAIDGLLNGANSAEDDLRRDPAYLSYYYSNGNLNPRLPHPSLSKEDWRVAQRFQAGTSSFGGIGDRRKVGIVGERANSNQKIMARHPSAEWVERGEDGLIGLSGMGMGARRKSLADIVQEELAQPPSLSGQISRPVSSYVFDDLDRSVLAETVSHSHNGLNTVDGLHSGAINLGMPRGPTMRSSLPHSFASTVGSSLSRSSTPDPNLVARAPSPGLPPVGTRASGERKSVMSMKSFNIISPSLDEQEDIAAAFSDLNIPKSRVVDGQISLQPLSEQERSAHFASLQDFRNGHDGLLHQQHMNNSDAEMLQMSPLSMAMYNSLLKANGSTADLNPLKMVSDKLPSLSSPGSSEQSNIHYRDPNSHFSAVDLNGYSMNQLLPLLVDNHNFNTGSKEIKGFRGRSQVGNKSEMPVMDPMRLQYAQSAAEYATQTAAIMSDPSLQRSYVDAYLLELQKAYFAALLSSQRSQHDLTSIGKLGNLNNGHYGSLAFGNEMPYHGGSLSGSANLRSPFRQGERNPCFLSSVRSLNGVSGSWHPENDGYMARSFGSSLLEEFKNNKTRSFELSDIRDHIVEFSADQYGSRFIQQKLETAAIEEKNMAFREIIPHARALMIDVFGNYVIQKFFGHGTESQRKELADHLSGHVLALSLQMYGCRVIQKALEVLDVEYQTQMVLELDGHIMQCVRDQNGNHVIQKSIECVPQERIQFIISSFYGQIVALSTHPYGCRVIQRVLEHCDDAKTQQIMMEEIMQSVCTLAQDQYGNYVVQHVLEHGKPHERSAIITKLAGQIVHMSQQKFASNVVEKCLTFGSPAERQLLVNEILGSTDENEPLQAMMKDQFANYVVQKVIDTCDDQQLELILSRIRVHLNALRRYTYGKHIVARVEKLVVNGERRMGAAISQAS